MFVGRLVTQKHDAALLLPGRVLGVQLRALFHADTMNTPELHSLVAPARLRRDLGLFANVSDISNLLFIEPLPLRRNRRASCGRFCRLLPADGSSNQGIKGSPRLVLCSVLALFELRADYRHGWNASLT